MGRLVNGERTNIDTIPEHAGKLLLFCEGATEFHYFRYLKEYLENRTKDIYTDVVVINCINTQGNAQHVFNTAEVFFEDDKNIAKYALYEKHLVFDCDAPERTIQDVILSMNDSPNGYVLDYSNLIFETWLVMHFKDLSPSDDISKAQIYKTMAEYLNIDFYDDKEKAAYGTIGAILGDDGNRKIRSAIENAKNLKNYWKKMQKDYLHDIKKMNPSVSVHELTERLLDEIEYKCI